MNFPKLSPSFPALFAGILLTTASATGQTLTVYSTPSNVTGGQGQVVGPNTQANVPLLVQLLSATGQPLAGQNITYAVTSPYGVAVSAGTVTGTSTVIDPYTGLPIAVAVTDQNGIATVGFIGASLPPSSYSFVTATITAAYAGTTSTATFFETTSTQVSGGGLAISSQILSPPIGTLFTGQSGAVSTTPIQVLLTSLFSNGSTTSAVPHVAVTIVTDTGSGATITCKEGAYVLTDATGVATCTPIFGKVGSGTFTINVGNFVTYSNVAFQVTVGPPALIQITGGNNQSGLPGAQLPLPIVATVTDIGGNAVSGVNVAFTSVTPGGATFTSVRSTSDTAGKVSATVILGSVPGAIQISIADTGGLISSPAIFTETVNITITGLTKVAGDNQSAILNAPFAQPLIAQIATGNGQPNSSLPVTFAVTSGSATLGTTSATTNAQGQASTTVTAGSTVGPVTVTATSGAFSVAFSLTVNPLGPSNLSFTNGASGVTNSVSPGSIVTIFGSGLAVSVQGVIGTTDIGPHPYNVAGVSVLFGTVPAPIFALGNTGTSQFITVQVPFETAAGTTPVTINTPGGGTATVPVSVSAASPGLFEYIASDNAKHLVALRPDGSVVSPSNPAIRNENIRFYATGLGPLTPVVGTNGFSPAASDPAVAYQLILGVANLGASFNSAIYARGLVGVEEINFTLPSSTTPGPVQISIGIQAPNGSVYYSQGSILNVQ